ncbi:MAG TPA: hypothetical protein VFF81_00675 [Noviherbaspirillum sp.]|nr:hypothetical protein [Noviherbaspirillum sp.]
MKDPAAGFDEVRRVLSAMVPNHSLFPLPEKVMRAAQWLHGDDITAARAMLDEIRLVENDIARAKAEQDIELLHNAIASGKVNEATHCIEIIAGRIDVIVYRPSAVETLTRYVSKLLG